MILITSMSEKEKELSRDSDLYQRAMKTRVINTEEYKSEIVEVLESRHSYTYHYRMSWRNLSEKGVRDGLSETELKKLVDMDPVERAEEFGKTHSHRWEAKGYIGMDVELNLLLKLPNGEKKEIFIQERIKSISDMNRVGYILNSVESNEKVNIRIEDDDEYILEIGDNTYECYDDLSSSSFSNTSKFSIRSENDKETRNILGFFARDERWIEGTVEKPVIKDEYEDILAIPVTYQVGNKDFKIEFIYEDSPETDDDFWELVEELGQGDPLMMEGEKVYISHVIASNGSSMIEDEMWSIRCDKPRFTIFRRIMEKLRLAKLRLPF